MFQCQTEHHLSPYGDEAADERTQISEALRDVQKRISYHQVWLKTEDAEVTACSDELVSIMRSVVGEEMKRRWKAAPIKKDADMVVGPKSFLLI